MPSWRLHKYIYELLMREVEGFVVWTPGLIDRIDKIIDRDYGEHDLGRGGDPLSFKKLLRALWLEFGDIWDSLNNRFLNTKSISERLEWERQIIMSPDLQNRYMLYIPDDAIVLVTLHHILDLCMYCILNIPIGEDKADLMLEFARRMLHRYYTELTELRTIHGRPFSEVFEWLIAVLKQRSKLIYNLLRQELLAKGLDVGLGPHRVMIILSDFVRKKGYYGIIYVDGRWLPLASAANTIWRLLIRGQEVTIGFSRYRGPYLFIYERIEVSKLRELFEKLNINQQ